MPIEFFNDAIDDPLLFERVQNFAGGANGFTVPVELQPNESQTIENMLVEDNLLLKTRFGTLKASGGSAPSGGKSQCLLWFKTPSVEQLITCANTAFAYYNGTTWTAMAGFTATTAAAVVASAQGNNLAYFSDGATHWWSWDGAAFADLGGTNSGTTGDPPIGATVMCWHTNRMFAAGVSSAPDTLYVSGILAAGTGGWNYTAWTLRIGGGNGDPIVGLVSLQNYLLLVVCRNSFYLVNANPISASAAEWEILRLPANIGGIARRAIIGDGNDAYVLSDDGIRSIRRMQAVGTQYEVAPPLSQPMQPYIDRINWAVAYKSCAWTYNQYLFFALPLDSATEPSHVLVFNQRTQSWMGVWTGWTPTQICTAYFSDNAKMVFGDTSGNVNFWLDYISEDLASTFQDNGTEIASKITSKAFNFQSPVNNKDAMYCEARFVDTQNIITIKLYLDEEEAWNQTIDSTNVQNQLPLNLPFNLASTKPYTGRNPLDGLDQFNECYLELSTVSGKMVIKNFTIAAYLNTLTNA